MTFRGIFISTMVTAVGGGVDAGIDYCPASD
jgi:hypothetical protein